MITHEEGLARYKAMSTRRGSIIPSDVQLSEEWGMPLKFIKDIRKTLKQPEHDYNYSHLPTGEWMVVFIPHNRNGRSAKPAPFDAEQALQRYAQDFTAYLEACDPKTLAEYNTIKKEARNYVLSQYPELLKAHDAYTQWWRRNVAKSQGKVRKGTKITVEPRNELEKLGNRVRTFGNNACRKIKDKILAKKRTVADKPAIINAGRPSTINLYQDWCANHDWIPNDYVLAHFTGNRPGTFSNYRTQLTRKGYKFNRQRNGWEIIKPEQWTEDDEQAFQAAEKARLEAEEAYQNLAAKRGRLSK